MLRAILLISTFIVACYGSGQLSILTAPKSLEFKGSDKLACDAVDDVLAASLGFNIEQSSEWQGLSISDPFDLPKAAVTVVVDGIERIHTDSVKSTTFETIGAGCQQSLNSLSDRIPQIEDLDLQYKINSLGSGRFADIKVKSEKSTSSSLKPQANPADKDFLDQVAVVRAVAQHISAKSDDLPKLLIVRLTVAPLIAAHGPASPQLTDALKVLQSAVVELKEAAEKAYGGNVLVATIAANNDQVRTKRAAAGAPRALEDEINLAKTYSADYPVMFNIILWFGVILTFSLLAISYTIGYMDPGRDSIIYRMTSTRMKKDN